MAYTISALGSPLSGMNRIYTPPYKPRTQQHAALDKCEGQEAFAFLMEMRTGKTKVTLDDWGRLELAGKCQDLAVIAPGGVYKTWQEACREHLSADLQQRARIFTWRSGSGAKEIASFLLDMTRPRVFLMNVEALSSVKAARAAMTVFLKARTAMLAIDEATIIKNPSAARTKFINRVLSPLADYRRILSGLLTPKGPLDLYAPFEFLDYRILNQRSYYGFRSRYSVMTTAYFGGRSIQQVVGYRNLEELQHLVAKASYRCTLADCYDLPPKVYMKREVPMTPEQARIYKELKTFATAALSATEHVTATVVIAQIIRLHQVLCGHTVDEMGTAHEIAENRTAALVELMSETEEKAIIWCSYDHDVRKVSAALGEEFGAESVARFWGGNRAEREQEESRFKTDPACRFMVATAAAGGRGRTWDIANLVVYYSNSYDLEHRSQSEERPQAVGKSNSVTYIDLLTPDTVDEVIIKALRAKISLATTIQGDDYRSWLI